MWGSAFSRRLEKLKEIKQFIPILLACAPMQPVVAAAPPARVKEIFVTREDALENDSLYHSLSFKFQLTEDEKDNSGVTVISSPLSLDDELKIHPIEPMTPFNLDSDLSGGTSHDEGVVRTAPPSLPELSTAHRFSLSSLWGGPRPVHSLIPLSNCQHQYHC